MRKLIAIIFFTIILSACIGIEKSLQPKIAKVIVTPSSATVSTSATATSPVVTPEVKIETTSQLTSTVSASNNTEIANTQVIFPEPVTTDKTNDNSKMAVAATIKPAQAKPALTKPAKTGSLKIEAITTR